MISLLLAVVTLAAPASPASQPATQPTTQPAVPRADEQVIHDAKFKFRFAVPKVWKPQPQQAEGIYIFQLPAVGESRRYTPTFILTARNLERRTFADEVAGRRDAIQQRNPGVKFDEDAAITLSDHDAWTFAYGTTLNQTVTDTATGQKHTEPLQIKVRDQIVVLDGRAIEFVLTGDEKGMPVRWRQVGRAIATLAAE